MKVTIEITEQEIKDLKLIRNYFGEHDKTQLEHLAYSELDKLVKKLQQADVIKSVCDHRSYRAGHSPFVPCICNDCGEEL